MSNDLPQGSKDLPAEDPGYAGVFDYLLYSLSLPERTLRSATSVVSGTLRESASLLVPQAFQNSKTYTVLVRQGLNFLAEDVGGVQRDENDTGPPPVENFVARKAVGNFIELAGLATMHLSPLMLLAVFSDVAYGSQAYLKELADELKSQGVIDEQSTIDHVDDLLKAVAGASKTAAGAFDTPPLSLEGLTKTVSDTRKAVASINPASVIPQAEVSRLWNEIHTLAKSQGVNPLAISGAATFYSLRKVGALGRGAISSVKVAGTLLDRHIIDHYQEALAEIAEKGIYASLAESADPYIEAVWRNYSPRQSTLTEKIFTGRPLVWMWSGVRGWLGKAKKADDQIADGAEDSATDNPAG
ncbi:MAG: hypothetical protein HQ581_13740 [Planctomycetes bacterium]|nr:hypothetical protein [Planctomycetota bacterium]